MTTIDLDALLGESKPKNLIYKGVTFDLPGELPGTALAPFLRADLGLSEIIADIFAADDTADTEDSESWMSALIDAVVKRPTLPVQFLDAARDALVELLGDGAKEFFALKPSVNALIAIATNVPTSYGMDLADFFYSGESSEADGTDSSPTSNGSTDSTHEASSDTPAPTDS